MKSKEIEIHKDAVQRGREELFGKKRYRVPIPIYVPLLTRLRLRVADLSN
jgi:hypothetical protein